MRNNVPQKTIEVSRVAATVARLCRQVNCFLPSDVWQALEKGCRCEASETGRGILNELLENARIAGQKEIALCQDTGLVEIFLKIGQDVHIVGGNLNEAIQAGVAAGYKDGYLRKSLVADPLERKNTGDNTPALIYTEIVEGDGFKITILPKGGGSENASALVMLNPGAGWPAVKEFVLRTVKEKGINACPPLVVGIGIGGSFSSVPLLAKKALLREVESVHAVYGQKEKELLAEINNTGIGPMGLGGTITALGVHIETAPCHIASLPVAVSMQCHSCRRLSEAL